ncbi:MAG TPA: hypothetical protein VL727_13850 [Puia sp.]|jgi:hypothetical protein|nr:hypothetical protein [Puia sp.]
MTSKSTIFLFIAVTLATSCSNKGAAKKDVDLLTATPWKYEMAGFGSGDDGNFDALDPTIAGSEKDNTIIFRKDGTGYTQQASRNKDSFPFIWALQNNDSTIYFQDQYYKIRVLSKHRLEIYADQRLGGSSTRYTIVLRH